MIETLAIGRENDFNIIPKLLSTLRHELNDNSDHITTQKKMLRLDTTPEWIAKDLAAISNPAVKKQLVQLYSILRDEESFTRDSETFPRSSYTLATPVQLASSAESLLEFLKSNGHLTLLSIWLQDPPAPGQFTTRRIE